MSETPIRPLSSYAKHDTGCPALLCTHQYLKCVCGWGPDAASHSDVPSGHQFKPGACLCGLAAALFRESLPADRPSALSDERAQQVERTEYDFQYEAQRIIDAIQPRAGARMTLVCALREAYYAGTTEAAALRAQPSSQEAIDRCFFLALMNAHMPLKAIRVQAWQAEWAQIRTLLEKLVSEKGSQQAYEDLQDAKADAQSY